LTKRHQRNHQQAAAIAIRVSSRVCTARTHELNELVTSFTDTKEKGSARVELNLHVKYSCTLLLILEIHPSYGNLCVIMFK